MLKYCLLISWLFEMVVLVCHKQAGGSSGLSGFCFFLQSCFLVAQLPSFAAEELLSFHIARKKGTQDCRTSLRRASYNVCGMVQ